MYSRCLLLSLPAAPLTFPPHNKRAPLNALYGVKVGVLESCHLIGSEDFAIPQSLFTATPTYGQELGLVNQVLAGRLWNGKILGAYQIAALISRDFFPKCHLGCISDAFRTLFRTLSEMHPKCIRNVSEIYPKFK